MRLVQIDKLFGSRYVWLMWLLLLLPIAQMSASMHLLSHVHSVESGQNKKNQHAIHEDHCDLCLSALAVVGGAPLDQAVISALFVTPSSAPRMEKLPFRHASNVHAYQSRAPPLSQN